MELSNDFRRKRYPKDIVPIFKPVEEKKEEKEEVVKEKPVRTITNTDRRKWAATESSISFNFGNLLKKVKKHINEQFPNDTQEQILVRISESLKTFSINDQVFEYVYRAIPKTYGGVRWYVLCPKCKKHVLKLFLPRLRDREPLYLCKYCHKLKPSSLILGTSKRYKSVTRPLNRLEQIKKKLLHKKLKIEEAEALLKEYERIEQKLAESPEYKLWLFKNEHGRKP